MPWAAAAIVGSSVIGGIASGDAADTQADAANNSTAANERMFNKNLELQQPWRDAGMGALSSLSSGIGAGGEFSTPFKYDQYADPGYQFRLQQGQNSMESSAAARGGLLSGGALKALMSYGQQAGSQEYGNAYNRWNNDVTNRFNRLASVAGVGQTATRDVSQMGTNMTNANNELMLQGANANASGTVGAANSLGNGISALGNWWQNKNSSTGLGYNPGAGYGSGYSGSLVNQGSSGGDAGGSYWGVE